MPLEIYIIRFQEKNLNLNRDRMLLQEERLRVNWQLNQDSSMVERQARDLVVRVRDPVQVQILLLKSENLVIIHVMSVTQDEWT